MGKGRDKKKAHGKGNSAKTKGKEAAKAVSKAKKKDEFEEIDSILKDLDAKQHASFTVTQTSNSAPPSPRSNGQLFSHGQNIFLFGGEYFDGISFFS
jgi:hypothetical protein